MIKAVSIDQIDSELLTPDGGIRLDKLEYFIKGMASTKAGPLIESEFYEKFLIGKFTNAFWYVQKHSAYYQDAYKERVKDEKKEIKRGKRVR